MGLRVAIDPMGSSDLKAFFEILRGVVHWERLGNPSLVIEPWRLHLLSVLPFLYGVVYWGRFDVSNLGI